jgi:hypothetical protein
MVDGSPQWLLPQEKPNHLVIDLQSTQATQCVHENCKTVMVHVDTAHSDRSHLTITADDSSVPFSVRMFSDGHYEDGNGATSFYYGHLSKMPRF